MIDIVALLERAAMLAFLFAQAVDTGQRPRRIASASHRGLVFFTCASQPPSSRQLPSSRISDRGADVADQHIRVADP